MVCGVRTTEREQDMTEVWKDISDYEGSYQVSNLGRVRSLPRTTRFMRNGKEVQQAVPGKVLSAKVNRDGHLFVSLCKEGKPKHWYVHTLVLTAFVGSRPDGMECLHRDGDPTNNRVENLRWNTSSQNKLDSVRHGTHVQARKTHCPHGHEYSEENTYIDPDGYRHCRTCCKAQDRKRRRRNLTK